MSKSSLRTPGTDVVFRELYVETILASAFIYSIMMINPVGIHFWM